MDLSWSELLVVGIVALIFIGPKDLPGMFREFGRFMAKVRSMGREFSRAMETAAKESGVKDVADDLRKVTNPKSMGLDAVRNAADRFEKWDPMKPTTTKPATTTSATTTPAAAPLTPPPMPPMPTTAPNVALGPATSALAEQVAAKKAASAETVAKLREAKTAAPAAAPAAAEPAAPAVKRGGRVRKKAEPGDEA